MKTLLIIGLCMAVVSGAPAWGQTNARPRPKPSEEAAPPVAASGRTQGRDTAAGSNSVAELIFEGKDHMRRGEWADAVFSFKSVLRLDPRHPYGRFGLGTALIELKKYREAAALLEGVLKESPKNPSVLNNLAWLYCKAEDESFRDYAKAKDYARQALLVSPENFMTWSTCAEAYYGVGEFKQAAAMAAVACDMARDAGVRNLLEYVDLKQRCERAAKAANLLD